MTRYAKTMSQALAEMKMNDPKLNKIFDKLKKGDKIKLKTSSVASRGSDFVEYIVKSKNVVNKGRVEKITLATVIFSTPFLNVFFDLTVYSIKSLPLSKVELCFIFTVSLGFSLSKTLINFGSFILSSRTCTSANA